MLRKDENQWLIYDRDSVEAVVAAVKAFLMGLGAQTLLHHEDLEIRALGHAGLRMSATQLDAFAGNLKVETSPERQEAAQVIGQLIGYLAGFNNLDPAAIDEIHAAIVWIDKRAKAAGVSGTGWYREIVREPDLFGLSEEE